MGNGDSNSFEFVRFTVKALEMHIKPDTSRRLKLLFYTLKLDMGRSTSVTNHQSFDFDFFYLKYGQNQYFFDIEANCYF